MLLIKEKNNEKITFLLMLIKDKMMKMIISIKMMESSKKMNHHEPNIIFHLY